MPKKRQTLFELPEAHSRNSEIVFGVLIEVLFEGKTLITRDVFQMHRLSYRLVAGYKLGEVERHGNLEKILIETVTDPSEQSRIEKHLKENELKVEKVIFFA